MRGLKNITGITTLALLYQGCLKPVDYPIEPVITFKSFTITNDPTAVISFTFTDGDGDIGLSDEQTEPPYDTGSVYTNNVFIAYYEKVNGVWQPGLDQGDLPVSFNYRTRYLTPEGKNKALRGTIEITMNPFYSPFSADNDTIRFKIKMCDRALHMSNEVWSNEIVR